MKNKIYFLFLFLLFNFVSVYAQNWECDTEEPAIDFLQNVGVTSYATSYSDKNINIYVHIIRRTNGTGGLTSTQVNNALDIMYKDYQYADICFTEMGRSNIQSDYYYSFTSSKFDGLITQQAHLNSIDIYLLPSTVSFGRASGIPGIALVLGGSYAGTSVLSHEMGHCLGLYHTHSGRGCGDFVNCAENINGSNCNNCGDRVCDTPADPCISGQVNTSCIYTGGGGFSPDTKNIQSYTMPGCMEAFTSGQFTRIHTMINNSGILQNVLNSNSCGADCPSSYNLTGTLSGSVTYEADNYIVSYQNIPGNINSGTGVQYNAGNSITLKNGFSVANGAVFRAYIDGCNDSEFLSDDIPVYKPIIAEVEKNQLSQLLYRIYPNPSRGKIKIEHSFENTSSNLIIHDYTGKLILEKNIESTNSELDLSHLTRGIYIVTLINGNNIFTEKLIISN